jgi:hypothetical protein
MPLFWQASVFRGNHDRCAFYFIVGRPVANQYNLPEYWCISLKSNKKGHVDVNTAFEAWRPTKKHCFIGSTYQRYRMYPVASIVEKIDELADSEKTQDMLKGFLNNTRGHSAMVSHKLLELEETLETAN